MTKTIEYLEKVSDCYNLTSDGQIAKMVGISRQAISQMRKRGTQLNSDNIITVGKLLNIDPEIIAVELMLEKSKTPEARTKWAATVSKLAGTIAILVLTYSPIHTTTLPGQNVQLTAAQCILC